ncbi:MAG: L-ribulose-5-phosphate 4-epimerase AraD [Oscillospiraceae bacterium]|jgi:L-ribulose-5-phosphate 4-epimerase|nr:L-ribulose-5-phosphate 4-epimerase AraD [Oscillospiraceae bacterium]
MKDYAETRRLALEANLLLARSGLAILTWGNASQTYREDGVFAIKPSGVPYERLTVDDLTVCSIETGEKLWGRLNPSTDTLTHAQLYRKWPEINGVCHAHPPYATAWSQASRALPALGTTHADTFDGDVPVTRRLTIEEIEDDYESATGAAIIGAFRGRDHNVTPAALARQHAPFTWGKDAIEAVERMMVLEECAKIAYFQYTLGNAVTESPRKLDEPLRRKHYERKHGANATYGQQL